MSNAMTSIITADEGVLYTSHRKISPDNLIKQWMKAETLLSFITLTSTMTIHSDLKRSENGSKWAPKGQKWSKMGSERLKMVQNRLEKV